MNAWMAFSCAIKAQEEMFTDYQPFIIPRTSARCHMLPTTPRTRRMRCLEPQERRQARSGNLLPGGSYQFVLQGSVAASSRQPCRLQSCRRPDCFATQPRSSPDCNSRTLGADRIKGNGASDNVGIVRVTFDSCARARICGGKQFRVIMAECFANYVEVGWESWVSLYACLQPLQHFGDKKPIVTFIAHSSPSWNHSTAIRDNGEGGTGRGGHRGESTDYRRGAFILSTDLVFHRSRLNTCTSIADVTSVMSP